MRLSCFFPFKAVVRSTVVLKMGYPLGLYKGRPYSQGCPFAEVGLRNVQVLLVAITLTTDPYSKIPDLLTIKEVQA